jgi:hypothetical protein
MAEKEQMFLPCYTSTCMKIFRPISPIAKGENIVRKCSRNRV